jgi:hypothetical protein
MERISEVLTHYGRQEGTTSSIRERKHDAFNFLNEYHLQVSFRQPVVLKYKMHVH